MAPYEFSILMGHHWYFYIEYDSKQGSRPSHLLLNQLYCMSFLFFPRPLKVALSILRFHYPILPLECHLDVIPESWSHAPYYTLELPYN